METFSFNDGFLALCLFLAVVLPLVSCVLSFLTSDRYSWLIILNAPFLLMLATVFATIVTVSCWNSGGGIIELPWLTLSEAEISANIFVSQTSLLMMVVVLTVSFLVHVYSVGYMAGDANPRKYFGVLGLFTFAMLGIVLSDNLLVLFVFWELVGFSSYLLIGHWDEKPEAGNAATKAFLYNRIGDSAFLIGIMILWSGTGTLEISALRHQTFSWQTAAALCIFGGVIGKSAQFPLFTWLADAMEGPTPVSALIHAATMVAAGVYLLIRLHPVFTDTALMIVSIVGAITALSGSISALVQFDIKKVLAYSTISQLGLMIVTIGASGPQAAFLHLFTHAFFKACLFLSAGSVIHTLHQAHRRDHHHFDVQDLRNLGGLRKKLPVTFLTFVISGASLAGIPFFSGFLSKEAMYASALLNKDSFSILIFFALAAVSFVTVLYSFRLIWFIFFGDERSGGGTNLKESPVIMRVPMILLALCSTWPIVSLNPVGFSGWIAGEIAHPWWLTIFSVTWVGVALATAFFLFRKSPVASNAFVANGYGLDTAYRFLFRSSVDKLASIAEVTDRKVIDAVIHASAYGHVTLAHIIAWLDKFLVDGLVHVFSGTIRWIGSVARSYQSGKIQDYILYAILALIIFLIWLL